MDAKEKQTVQDLLLVVSELRLENKKMREDTHKLIESINTKVEKKHLPVTLEQDILITAQQSIQTSIAAALTGYSSPLTKLVASVIDEHTTELREIISNSFNIVIRTDNFKESIVNAFSHKVSRSIISNNDGLFDKVSNELKQDSLFKAKMALAVSTVVEEVLKQRNIGK